MSCDNPILCPATIQCVKDNRRNKDLSFKFQLEIINGSSSCLHRKSLEMANFGRESWARKSGNGKIWSHRPGRSRRCVSWVAPSPPWKRKPREFTFWSRRLSFGRKRLESLSRRSRRFPELLHLHFVPTGSQKSRPCFLIAKVWKWQILVR